MRKIFCDLCRKEILPMEKKVRVTIGNNTGVDPAETTWDDVCLDCAEALRRTAQVIRRRKEEDRQLVSNRMSYPRPGV